MAKSYSGDLSSTGQPINKNPDLNDAEPADGEVVTWNSSKDKVDFQVGGGGGSKHIIRDEGTDKPARLALNFLGTRVSATDDLVGNETEINVTAEINTNSNVGGGEGLVKTKVVEDTPLKSLLGTASEIILVGGVDEITFSLASIIERTTNKDVANGYAGLDAGDLVLLTKIPNLPASRITSGRFPLARLPDAVDGRFFRGNGAGSDSVIEAINISKGGTYLDPAVKNIIVWRAPFACTVTNVRAYRVGGTGATINARKNGTLDHLSANLSLTSADTWLDGGAVQNTAYAIGDKLEIKFITLAGTPTQIAIQVDYTRP